MLENLKTKFTYQPLIGKRLRHGKFISDVQYMTLGTSHIYEDFSLVVRKTHLYFFPFLLYCKKTTPLWTCNNRVASGKALEY